MTGSVTVKNVRSFSKRSKAELAVPISILVSNLITFAIQFGQVLALMAYFALTGASIHPNGWIVLIPFLLAMMAGLGLGFGIIVCGLTTRYRDLQFVVPFGAQLLMYATPVIYPLSSISDRYRWLLALNPMTAIVESFRFAFLGAGTVSALHLVYSFACTIAVLAVGVLLFNRVEDTFMDTI